MSSRSAQPSGSGTDSAEQMTVSTLAACASSARRRPLIHRARQNIARLHAALGMPPGRFYGECAVPAAQVHQPSRGRELQKAKHGLDLLVLLIGPPVLLRLRPQIRYFEFIFHTSPIPTLHVLLSCYFPTHPRHLERQVRRAIDSCQGETLFFVPLQQFSPIGNQGKINALKSQREGLTDDVLHKHRPEAISPLGRQDSQANKFARAVFRSGHAHAADGLCIDFSKEESDAFVQAFRDPLGSAICR